MDRELSKTAGVLWNFSQPIADNMEEAVSGVKGELAIKLYGDELGALEEKGEEVAMRQALIGGCIGIVLGTLAAAATWNRNFGPHWYPVAMIVLALPQSWLGAKLYLRSAPSQEAGIGKQEQSKSR